MHETDDPVRRRLATALTEWARLAEAISGSGLQHEVDTAGAALVAALRAGHKVMFAGNGGSAAMASHMAAEFIGKCVQDRAPLPAVSLSESPVGITAIGNDYGFDEIFTRGVRALGRPGDVLVLLTTSGSSPNVRRAMSAARESGIVTIVMTGARGESLRGDCDHLLVVPSHETPRVQEVHLMWGHAWCEAVDELWQS